MSEKQWVQHISGQGEKWEVSGKLYNQEDHNDWQVTAKNDTSPFNYHYLPKSEYRLCEPPEVWRDVTEECNTVPCGDDIMHCGGIIRQEKGYRLRKVQLWKQYEGRNEYTDQWAFIVEQKVKS